MTNVEAALASAEGATGPDEAALYEHLAHARYQSGADRDRWRLIEVNWPYGIFAVSAAPRPNGPDEFALRFDLTGYPQIPTAGAWHVSERRYLTAEERPKGQLAGFAFRSDWHEGHALYIPCDRLSIEGHPDWTTRHPSDLWDPQVGITSYLIVVHRILNDEDYQGV